MDKFISERDPIMATRADKALELRLHTSEYLLLIAGKLHVPGLVRHFVRKGYREGSLGDLIEQKRDSSLSF